MRWSFHSGEDSYPVFLVMIPTKLYGVIMKRTIICRYFKMLLYRTTLIYFILTYLITELSLSWEAAIYFIKVTILFLLHYGFSERSSKMMQLNSTLSRDLTSQLVEFERKQNPCASPVPCLGGIITVAGSDNFSLRCDLLLSSLCLKIAQIFPIDVVLCRENLRVFYSTSCNK
jgi:hypothetical protein